MLRGVLHAVSVLAIDEDRAGASVRGPRVRAAAGCVDAGIIHTQRWSAIHVDIRRALDRWTDSRVRARRAAVRIGRHVRLVSESSLSWHSLDPITRRGNCGYTHSWRESVYLNFSLSKQAALRLSSRLVVIQSALRHREDRADRHRSANPALPIPAQTCHPSRIDLLAPYSSRRLA